MARRQREKKPPVKPFDEAFDKIFELERRACYRTVTCDFTPTDVVEWLVTPDVLSKLKRAKEAYNETYHLAQWGHPVTKYEPVINLRAPTGIVPGIDVALHVETAETPYLCPKDIIWSATPERQHNRVQECLYELYAVYERFNQVRRVIHWFNDYGTLGSARFYFPSIVSLLPVEHPIHAIDGKLHRPPRRPLREIANDVREAMTTVAMGLLTADTTGPDGRQIKIEFVNEGATRSQTFYLL